MCVKCLALCQASEKHSVNISSSIYTMIINHDLGGLSYSQISEIPPLTVNFIEAVDHALVSLLRYKLKA